jgi:hypothetical protein
MDIDRYSSIYAKTSIYLIIWQIYWENIIYAHHNPDAEEKTKYKFMS